MTTHEKNHALREHLALISTEAYLMLRSNDEGERIDRYNLLQEQIEAILRLLDDHKPSQYSCPDFMLQ